MVRISKKIDIKCKYCEVIFRSWPSQFRDVNQAFCSKPCWYTWKSKNVPAWNKGQTKKTDSRLIFFRPTTIKKGQHLSVATEFKVGDKVGPKNNLWKGGITPKNTMIRQSAEYKKWRLSVFERDNYTCQFCQTRGVKLHADHIKPFALYEDLRFEIPNGRTLCVPCHKKTDTYLKRKQVA